MMKKRSVLFLVICSFYIHVKSMKSEYNKSFMRLIHARDREDELPCFDDLYSLEVFDSEDVGLNRKNRFALKADPSELPCFDDFYPLEESDCEHVQLGRTNRFDLKADPSELPCFDSVHPLEESDSEYVQLDRTNRFVAR